MTLSDKRNPCGYCDNDLRSKDVKEFIKELKEWVGKENATIRGNTINKKIDKLAGGGLT